MEMPRDRVSFQKMSICSTPPRLTDDRVIDRKSTRLNSSHSQISYAVFCLKKKNKITPDTYAGHPAPALEQPATSAVSHTAPSMIPVCYRRHDCTWSSSCT